MIPVLFSLFFVALAFGQLAAISLMPGITVYVHDILALGIILVYGVKYFQKKIAFDGELLYPIGLFIAVALISLTVNVMKFSAIQLLLGSLYLWRFILYAGLYVVVRNEKLSRNFYLMGLYATGVAVAAMGFIQLAFYPSLRNMIYQGWDEHYYRLFSTFFDPNFAGLFLVLSLFVGFILYVQKNRIWILLGEILIGMAIVLTYSRSTFLACVAGVILYSVLSKQRIVMLLLVFGAFFYLGLPNHGIDANRLFRTTSSIARIQSYRENLSLITHSPIIGIGFNTLRSLATRERMLDSNGIPSRDAGGLNNSLLVVIITTGLIGFGVFMNLLVRMFRMVLREKNILGYGGLSCLIAVVVHSMFNNSLFYAWILVFVFILLGSVEDKKNSQKRVGVVERFKKHRTKLKERLKRK